MYCASKTRSQWRTSRATEAILCARPRGLIQPITRHITGHIIPMWGPDCVARVDQHYHSNTPFKAKSERSLPRIASPTVLDTSHFCRNHPCTSSHDSRHTSLPHLQLDRCSCVSAHQANNAIRFCAVRAAGALARCICVAASCVAKASFVNNLCPRRLKLHVTPSIEGCQS